MRIEKSGKPVVVIVAPAFKNEFISRSTLAGMPYLPFVIVDYDQSFIPLVPQQVEKAFKSMIKALTIPVKDLEKIINTEII